MVSSKQALAEAHAAAARRASRARVAALKAGTAKPTVDATWAKLMQSCADCQQRAEAAETVQAWRAFASAAHALRGAVGSTETSEEPGCRTCQPRSFSSSRGVTCPHPPKEEPTPEERRTPRSSRRSACAPGLGSEFTAEARAAREAAALATARRPTRRVERPDLAGGGLRGDGRDGSILEMSASSAEAAQLSPDDDEPKPQPPSRRVGGGRNDG